VNRSDRLAAPANDVTRQICSFCTAELLVAENPVTAQIGGSVRGYQGVGGPLSSPGTAY
jgi:hypothetical protein